MTDQPSTQEPYCEHDFCSWNGPCAIEPTTQEAEKALETIEQGLLHPYDTVTEALAALRSLRTQHAEQWAEIERLEKAYEQLFRESVDASGRVVDENDRLQLQHTKDQERIEELEAALKRISSIKEWRDMTSTPPPYRIARDALRQTR